MEYPYIMRHLDFASGCGKPAFYLKRELKLGDPITADDVVWLDGTPAVTQEPIRCGTCGGYFRGDIPEYCVERNEDN